MPKLLVDSRDVRFILFEMLGVDKYGKYEEFAGHDHELYEDTIKLAERISVEQFYPTNAEGDRIGVRYDPMRMTVATPSCFKRPYRAMSEAGFIGISADPAFGGLGLPLSISVACKEYFCAANGCLAFYTLLTGSAAHLVQSYGSETQKRIYLSRMLCGEWSGTMCLTEPDAGSEVGNVKTNAVRREDGAYLIKGQKIFISGGEHDLTENIIHMVLARIVGDSPGTKGLSLFIVPKYIPDSNGAPGTKNDVTCAGVEEKMGIHGLSTCTLVFGEKNHCFGYLLGAERKGMHEMFQMMNEERLFVGLQALSVSSAAYMHAVEYAKTRLQGRHITRMLNPKAPQVPIIEHPDVRRMLLWMKSYVEGMRMLTYFLGHNLDIATVDTGEAGRYARSLTELLIPLCKAGNADTAWLVTAEAIQVYGGYGYCRDYTIEQYARECKILSIVEGTNGIQSIDLLMRKIIFDRNGRNLKVFWEITARTLLLARGVVQEQYITPIEKGFTALETVLKTLYGQMEARNLQAIFGNATMFRKAMFLLCLGWMHLWSLSLASSALARLTGLTVSDCEYEAIRDNPEALFYYGKALAARFFIGIEFPRFFSYVEAILNNEAATAIAEAGIFNGMN